MRESEYKLHQIIDSAIPGMLWVTGPDGEVTRVNQRTLDFTGAGSVEDLLNLGWKKFLHPEDFPKTANAFRSFTRSKPENRTRICSVCAGWTANIVGTMSALSHYVIERDASSSGTVCLLISMKARRSKGGCAVAKPIWRKHSG